MNAAARSRPHAGLSRPRAEELSGLLRALGHPLRLQIVAALCAEEVHVNALAERLGAPQAVISQQLRILRMCRLVEVTRERGLAVYRLGEPRLRGLLRCMEGCSVG